MKKLVLLALSVAVCVSAQAQGTVSFATLPPNAAFIHPDGIQDTYSAQLWAGPAADSLAPVGAPVAVRSNGRVLGPAITIDSIPAQGSGFFQLELTSPSGLPYLSNVFPGGTGGAVPGSPTAPPAALSGITEYNVVPEPSTIALGILGAGLLLWRRRK